MPRRRRPRAAPRLLVALLALLGALGAPRPAGAHKPSDAYLALTVDGARVEGRWDIALRDLEHAIGLDGDGDGTVTWGELSAARDRVAGYALGRLDIDADGRRCPALALDQLVVEHADGAYAVLLFAADCPGRATELGLRYRLFDEVDPLHRGLLRVGSGDRVQSHVFARDRPAFTVRPDAAPDLVGQAWVHFREGALHIWLGLDHVLFVLTLMGPALLRRKGGRWGFAGGSPRGSPLVGALATVTAFTAAHAVTLSLAALGWVHAPPRLTESLIALSVALAALNNVWPVVTRRLWAVAFGFGLVHGLGFAGTLSELGLPGANLALALAAFNLGVEAGQLAALGLLLPLVAAFWSFFGFAPALLRVASAAVAAVAAGWFLERAFGLGLPGA